MAIGSPPIIWDNTIVTYFYFPLEPVTKRLKSSSDLNSSSDGKWTKFYGSELIVYDKHNRCLLTNGEYDLVLHDATPGGRSGTIARSPHKALMAQWETIPNVSCYIFMI